MKRNNRKWIKIAPLVRKFGWKGIWIYLRFRYHKTGSIVLPGIPHSMALRSNSTDIPTFRQIFLWDSYAVKDLGDPAVIIDAGANIGLAAVYFASRFPQARVLSIEPEEENYQLLVKNVSKYENIVPLHRALSNEPDQLLNVIDKGFGRWAFMTEKIERSENEKSMGSTKSITIDEIREVHNIDIIDILKIDIEGAEKELFEDKYQRWLPKTRIILIELHDRYKKGASKAFFKAISRYDFSYSQSRENLVFKNNKL